MSSARTQLLLKLGGGALVVGALVAVAAYLFSGKDEAGEDEPSTPITPGGGLLGEPSSVASSSASSPREKLLAVFRDTIASARSIFVRGMARARRARRGASRRLTPPPPLPAPAPTQAEKDAVKARLLAANGSRMSDAEAEAAAAESLTARFAALDETIQARHGVSPEQIRQWQDDFYDDAEVNAVLRDMKILIIGLEQCVGAARARAPTR